MLPKIYLCFPEKSVGGMSMLFMRLAENLSETKKADTFLVDYEDGYMARNHNPQLTKLLPYTDIGDPVVIPENAFLILQSMTPWSIFPNLVIDRSVKLLFWSCYPFGLIPLLPGFRTKMQSSHLFAALVLNTVLVKHKTIMQRFARLLTRRNAIVFQDQANVRITKIYLGEVVQQPRFLNIPSLGGLPRKNNPTQRIRETNTLRLTWIGRIVDMKFNILVYTLKKLDGIQEKIGVSLQVAIIGSGDYLPRLRDRCKAFDNLSIYFISGLSPEELDRYILEDTDVLFAMGTSALEGAKFGVPTIITDISFREVEEGYVFKWLHERKNSDIADFVDFQDLQPGNVSLQERLLNAVDDYADVSAREADNYETNHNLNQIASQMLHYAKESNLTWGEIEDTGTSDRGLAYRLFSGSKKFFK